MRALALACTVAFGVLLGCKASLSGSDCADGANGCPCYGNGSCDASLECAADVCQVPGCTAGTDGCPCIEGQCLGALACENNLCTPAAGTDGTDSGTTSVTSSTSGSSASTGSTTVGTTVGSTTAVTSSSTTSSGSSTSSTSGTTGGSDPYGPCDPLANPDAACPNTGEYCFKTADSMYSVCARFNCEVQDPPDTWCPDLPNNVGTCLDYDASADGECGLACTVTADCPAAMECQTPFAGKDMICMWAVL